MKHARITIWMLLILMWLVVFLPEGIAQSDYRIRDAIVVRKLDGRGGIPLFWNGFMLGRYAGMTRDCFFYDYTGAGNYIVRLQGDSADVFTIDKDGNVWAAGGIAPAGGVQLPDTDNSNWLSLIWNENDVADRNMNFLVNGADRTIDLSDDLVVAVLANTRLMATDGTGTIGTTDLFTWVAGTADDITVTDDLDGTITLSSVAHANTVTVGATGCDYTTIQAALTASGADTLVLVYPGTYTDDTINFTANNQTVRGADLTAKAIVTSADTQISNFGAYAGCRIDNIFMSMTAVTTAKDMITGTGTLRLRWVHLEQTCATDIAGTAQPSCINTTGDVKMTFGTTDYNHTGESVAGIKAPIRLGTGALVNLNRVNIDIDTQGDAVASTTGYGIDSGILNLYRCDIDVANIAGAISGLEDTFTIGHAYLTGSGYHELRDNDFHVLNNNSMGIGIYAGGTVTLRSLYNHIHVESTSGTANSFYFGAAGVVIDSQLDDIIAADGENNAAGGTYGYCHSPADGDYAMSSDLTVGERTIFTPTATQVINAVGDAILANGRTVVLDPDADYVLTSTPTIADGTTGEVVYVTCGNAEANTVWVQDQDTLGGSNIQLLNDEASRAITGQSTVSLRFDGTDWVEFGGRPTPVTDKFIPANMFKPQGDGADNNIVPTIRADATANRMFNRSDSNDDTQDMDWYTEYQLPEFCTGITTLRIYTRASDFANCAMTMTLEDQDGNADATGAVVITPTGNDTWEEFTYTPTSAYTSLEHIWIKIAITSLDTGDTADFGGVAADL